jgi:DNA-binding transcriptional LysR family regulator
MKKALPTTTFRLRSANYDDCIAMFLRRYVDLLLCYRTARTGAKIPDSFAREITLGNDLLIPVAREDVKAGVSSDPNNSRPIPLLSYPENSFLGEVVRKDCIARLIRSCDFEIVCESSFSAGLKEMAMKGMGVAWLPRRLVGAELNSKALVELNSELGSVELQVLLYWNHGAQPQLSIAALESLRL